MLGGEWGTRFMGSGYQSDYGLWVVGWVLVSTTYYELPCCCDLRMIFDT